MARSQIRRAAPWLYCLLKQKFTFIVVTLEINKYTKIPRIAFSYRLYSIGRTQNIPENNCSFGNGTPNQWAPTKNVLV